MKNYKKLSDKEIHEIWNNERFESHEEVDEFQKELVRRGMVSWEEINTKFEIIKYDNKQKNDIKKSTDNCLKYYVRENFKLKKELKDAHEALGSISSMLFSIGGPLNDNVRQYNKEQLRIFFRINDEIRSVI